ncbi:LytTR family DNA-binding domain-containing protein [Pelagicoccus sp. SDUM812002]|uniref:LytR/AlgR family response regulator transcription factor n=1 Tax=Pelagicoccus sp. SDUM812002 TaxID=3041266 RepID=UPI00280EFF2C|nr:LytTR family DNA-binding domain-containing protein [Pelagicoccus sp. SDUM812002]MDQ8186158.1 LytTR family DNA-binding domain-containing protein [Pelagicoccus sp. SDUM812002]
MNVLIVEDELPAARRLRRLVAAQLYLDESQIALAETLEQAQAQLESSRIDLLFLDLDLAGQNGFQLLRSHSPDRVPTIVVSANTDRAIEAFDQDVIDFIPKPVVPERLARALDRTKHSDTEEKRITIVSIGKIDIVPTKTITHISGAEDYAEIHTSEGQRLLHHERLNQLESTLPKTFLRIHRSHIVNLNFVRRLASNANGNPLLELTTGQTLPISRRRASNVRSALANHKT